MDVSSIEDVIKDASQGKIFILIDDENRENEGDLCVLGDFVNPNVINFMATHGRGLICLAITKQQSDKLGLSLMERRNESRYDTAFTQSIEATHGVTTGISASDRSITIKTAINEQNNENHITTPGHVFPIIARNGGTLIRAGHTEAIVDIAKICGLNPSGVICEIMKDNGEMARLPDLKKFAKKHGLKIGTIADLISYRRKNENLLVRTYEKPFNSSVTGSWRIIVYKSLIDEVEHLALIKGIITSKDTNMVRVHSFNPVEDILGDLNANGQNNLIYKAMKKIDSELPVYLFSGQQDPVGGNGRGVLKLQRALLDAAIKQVDIKLYSQGRHEMLNETNRAEVYEDLVNWLRKTISL